MVPNGWKRCTVRACTQSNWICLCLVMAITLQKCEQYDLDSVVLWTWCTTVFLALWSTEWTLKFFHKLPLNTSLHTLAAVSLQNHILNSIVRIQLYSFHVFLTVQWPPVSHASAPGRDWPVSPPLLSLWIVPSSCRREPFWLHQTVKSQPFRSDLILLPPHVTYLLKSVPGATMVNVSSIRKDFYFWGENVRWLSAATTGLISSY